MRISDWSSDVCSSDLPQEGADHESEEGQEALLRNAARPSSESEAGPKPAPDGSLRIPKQDRTVRNDRINEVRTVPRARPLQNLRLPDRFQLLKHEQQSGALGALRQVDDSLRPDRKGVRKVKDVA